VSGKKKTLEGKGSEKKKKGGVGVLRPENSGGERGARSLRHNKMWCSTQEGGEKGKGIGCCGKP